MLLLLLYCNYHNDRGWGEKDSKNKVVGNILNCGVNTDIYLREIWQNEI